MKPMYDLRRPLAGRGISLATALLAAVLALGPLTAIAAPSAQLGTRRNTPPPNEQAEQQTVVEAGGEPLLLGQYANAPMAAGDTVSYEVVIPESGTYLITAVDDTAAADFDLVVTDEAGTELYNDVFATTELALEAGTITLNFTAAADNTLFMVVLGQIGAMSDDERAPGKLLPGSVYLEEDVSEARYATVTVPETAYPQQVLVYVEPGDGDTFYAYAEGESVYASITTDSDNILRFWTQGGEYKIYAEPYDRRSDLTLIVFLSGRPAEVTLDTPREAALAAGVTEMIYEIQLDSNYTDLEIAIDSDGDLGVTLLDTYYNSQIYHSSYGEDTLEIDALYPGVYYILVQASEKSEEETPYTLSITGDAGRPTAALELGVPFDDEFTSDDESINYSFDVVNPGSEVVVTISGADSDTDFDMYAGLRPGSSSWSAYSYGSEETLTFLAPIAGTYYITVVGNGDEGPFTIQAAEGEVAPLLENGAVIYDLLEGGVRNNYLLPVTEGGQLLTVALVGPASEDFDLSVNGFNARGDNILSLSGYSSGSAEIVSYVVAEPGNYAVSVSSYGEDGGYYFLQAQVVDPRTFGGQWAIDAVASSQAGDDDFSALQATGPSDSDGAPDSPTAWIAAEDDGGEETLELTFTVPVIPHAVVVTESANPGAITRIEALDPESGEWVVIYEGAAAPTEEGYRVFVPTLTPVDFATDQLRLTLDTAAVPGANQIDAVQLYGRP
jgi:hypothetical protein